MSVLSVALLRYNVNMEKKGTDIRSFMTAALPVVLFDFIVCGFVGWAYETILTSVVFGRFVERGVLPIPLLPIYGLFALILPFVFKKENNPFNIIAVGAIGATLFELIGAYVTEFLFHERLWTYADWKWNFFDGRISVFSSLIFGVLCVLFVKGIHPLSLFLAGKYKRAFPVAIFVLSAALVIACFVIK